MSSANFDFDPVNLPDATLKSFGIVVSDWNSKITSNLLNGCLEFLRKKNVLKKNIHITHVPGSFELTFGTSVLGETTDVDAIITLGSVIKGETKHFDFVCQGVSNGITQLNITLDIPVIFGLLTDNTLQQAIDRSGGKLGNKGIECAIAAIKMASINQILRAE